MKYTIEKTDEGRLYTNTERTGTWDEVLRDAVYEVTIYSHPNGRHAWDKKIYARSKNEAAQVAIAWCRDGVLPDAPPDAGTAAADGAA